MAVEGYHEMPVSPSHSVHWVGTGPQHNPIGHMQCLLIPAGQVRAVIRDHRDICRMDTRGEFSGRVERGFCIVLHGVTHSTFPI